MRTTSTKWKRAVATFATLAVGLCGPIALAVPAQAITNNSAPKPTDIAIRVAASGDGANGLGDVVISAFAGSADANPKDALSGTPADTCTTATAAANGRAKGECILAMPRRTGGGGYWIGVTGVVGSAESAGWVVSQTLKIGDNGSARDAAYAVYVPGNVDAYGTAVKVHKLSDVAQATTANDRQFDGRFFAVSRANPLWRGGCNLRIAIVLDFSSSMNTAVNGQTAFTHMMDAAVSFAEQLQGTPAQIAIVQFSTTAQLVGGTTADRVLNPDAALAQLKVMRNGSASGWTNWDDAFAKSANIPWSGTGAWPVDVAVVITDGDPTAWGTGGGGSGQPSGTVETTFQRIERGIWSANALKAAGTHVIAVGTSVNARGPSDDNLMAISGPKKAAPGKTDGDYWNLPITQLPEWLTGFYKSACGGSLNVVKYEADADGLNPKLSTKDRWSFTADAAEGVLTDGTSTTHMTNDSGGVTYTIGTGGKVTITEAPAGAPGKWKVVPAAGNKNAICTNTITGADIPVVNEGDTGWSLTVPSTTGAIVSCKIVNRPLKPADIVVHKKWAINGGAPIDDSQAPEGFDAAPTIAVDGTPIATPVWESVYGGYAEGQTAVIGEKASVPAGCYALMARIEAKGSASTAAITPPTTQSYTLAEGLNEYTITNTVWCKTYLSLVKSVPNPNGLDNVLPPTAWTLTAQGQGSAGDVPTITGAAGSAAVTEAEVDAGRTYVLTESDKEGYIQEGSGATNLKGSGAWAIEKCVLDDGVCVWTSIAAPIGSDGSVVVPLGHRYRATAVNHITPRLTLKKATNTATGGADVPVTAWQLIATPVAGGDPVVLSNGELADLTPGQYELSESGPTAHWTNTSLLCEDSAGARVVSTDGVVDLTWDTHVTCTFTNTYDPLLLMQKKVVTDVDGVDRGGDATPADWNLVATPFDVTTKATTGAPVVMRGDATTAVTIRPGTYLLTESGTKSGYAQTQLVCTAKGSNDNLVATVVVATADGDVPGKAVTLTPGTEVSCEFTNEAQPATLTLLKETDYRFGGSEGADQWWLEAHGIAEGNYSLVEGTTGVTDAVKAGWYTLEESNLNNAIGYAQKSLSCVDTSASARTVEMGETADVDKMPTVEVEPGMHVVCTFVNEDLAPRITLEKTVLRGPLPEDVDLADADSWPLFAELTSENPNADAFDGLAQMRAGKTEAGDTWVDVVAGAYSLYEGDGPAGYRPSTTTDPIVCTVNGEQFAGDELELKVGEHAYCTFVNEALALPQLTLHKVVENPYGGIATPDQWSLNAWGGVGQVLTGAGVALTPTVGVAYDLFEGEGPAGYRQTDLTCTGEGFEQVDADTVVFDYEAVVDCTFTNTEQPASLLLTKTVVNDDDGEETADAWTLHATADDAEPITMNGVGGAEAAARSHTPYTLTEEGPDGYDLEQLVCTGLDGEEYVLTGDDENVLTIRSGDAVVCEYTNNDEPVDGAVLADDPLDKVLASTGGQVTLVILTALTMLLFGVVAVAARRGRREEG